MSDSDLDDLDLNTFESEEQKGRRFKKNTDNAAKRQSTASTSMQLQLNKLSDREVDDANMKSVFGPSPHKQAADSMRVNPLYEKGVTPTKRSESIELGSNQHYDGPTEIPETQTTGSGLENGKSTTGTEDGPTILYNDNFKLKNKDSPPTKPKIAKFGRIIPARVKRNTHRTGLQPVAKAPSQTTQEQDKDRMNLIEENFRRRRIRRGFRYVLLLILAFLVFILLLTIVLYFATQDARK
ncbi:hypothetical protein HOLleu_28394 [Holothuria leucospilota]|uniref:Uncharacterized protein n=1 Tax=Holothuria leucospilota TaxID=206669 RepID=A0A9Q1BLZ4_HOLLE|nr:hypothetical protein HOLleu_28394 [Holothuria leucospilota]